MTSPFDTSGYVDWRGTQPFAHLNHVAWFDLSPFEQGYVTALFGAYGRGGPGHVLTGLGFSDLDPETLERIGEDCAAIIIGLGRYSKSTDSDLGRKAWKDRQANLYRNFPPLTVFLNEAGKVCLRSTSAPDAPPLHPRAGERT